MDPAIVWTVVCCQVMFLAVLLAFFRSRSGVDSKSEPAPYTWENFMADIDDGVSIDIIHRKCLMFGVPKRPKEVSLVIPNGTLSIPWATSIGLGFDTSTFVVNNNGAQNLNLSANNMPLEFRAPVSIQRYQ